MRSSGGKRKLPGGAAASGAGKRSKAAGASHSNFIGVSHDGRKWLARFGNGTLIGLFDSEAEAVVARDEEYARHGRHVGVVKKGKKWRAQMRVNGKRETIGIYSDWNEAAAAMKRVEAADDPAATVKAIQESLECEVLVSNYLGVSHDGRKWRACFDRKPTGDFDSEAEAVAARDEEYAKHGRHAGVCKFKKKWEAQMTVNSRTETIGSYADWNEAVAAVKRVEASDDPAAAIKAIRRGAESPPAKSPRVKRERSLMSDDFTKTKLEENLDRDIKVEV